MYLKINFSGVSGGNINHGEVYALAFNPRIPCKKAKRHPPEFPLLIKDKEGAK